MPTSAQTADEPVTTTEDPALGPALDGAKVQLMLLVLEEDVPVDEAARRLLEHADVSSLRALRSRVDDALDQGPSAVGDRADAIVAHALELIGMSRCAAGFTAGRGARAGATSTRCAARR